MAMELISLQGWYITIVLILNFKLNDELQINTIIGSVWEKNNPILFLIVLFYLASTLVTSYK